MRRLILALFCLILVSCTPVFEQAEPGQITLTYQNGTLELTSSEPIERGSVAVRAESVSSRLCAVRSCVPNTEGRVLLRLPVGVEWGRSVDLGRVEGLVRAKAAIVRVGEKRALEIELTP